MQLQFTSAYKQLQPAERSFVDAVVSQLERENERIGNALSKPIPANMIQSDTRGMLQRPVVQAAISERVTEIARDREFSPLRIVKEMTSIALGNIRNYYEVDADGVPIFNLANLTPEETACIKSIEIEDSGDGITRPGKRKFKFVMHDKLSALKMLAQIAGLLENDSTVRREARAADAPPIVPTDTVESAADKYTAMLEGS